MAQDKFDAAEWTAEEIDGLRNPDRMPDETRHMLDSMLDDVLKEGALIIPCVNNALSHDDSEDARREAFNNFIEEMLNRLGWCSYGSQGCGNIELMQLNPLETNEFMNALLNRKRHATPATEPSPAGENPPVIPR